jgi:hypothetical protein
MINRSGLLVRFFALPALLAVFGFMGCGSDDGSPQSGCTGEDCDDSQEAGAPVDSGPDEAEDAADEPDAPEDTVDAEPVRRPEVITVREDLPDDEFDDINGDGIDGDVNRAIFVAPEGSDENPGSMDEPVRSISHGIELAQEQGKDVYVCAATYTEALVIEGQGVDVYGGYNCATGWERGRYPVEVRSPAGPALVVRDVSEPMRVDWVSFTGLDADPDTPGESSIAVLVVNADALEISHAEIVAGDGAAGADGEAGEDASILNDSTDLDGQDAPNRVCSDNDPCPDVALGASPTGGRSCAPTSAETWGGRGGDGANFTLSAGSERAAGEAGLPGMPAAPEGELDGADGADGDPGDPATEAFGTVSEEGYLATNSGQDGSPGETGGAGTGGEGGDSWCEHVMQPSGEVCDIYYWVGGGGGAGGPGGCPGGAGRGGGAGGASIALLAINSPVRIARSTLSSGSGGDGGRGGPGGSGAAGGPGGAGGMSSVRNIEPARLQAQSGGDGGEGGDGGAGGPGAGGPSIALVTAGPEAELIAPDLLFGNGGIGATSDSGDARAVNGEAMQLKTMAAPD